MPLRRSLFTVFCLAVLGMPPVNAQEKDPFEEWDRIHSRTTARSHSAAQQARSVDELAARAHETIPEKLAVTYFSPAAIPTSSAEAVPSAISTSIPMREKASARPRIAQQRAEIPSSEASNTGRTGVENASFSPALPDTPHSKHGRVSTAAWSPEESEAPQTGGIRKVAFAPDAESAAVKRLRMLAAGPNSGDVANSFEEFLGTAPAATQQNSRTSEPHDDIEEETAEPLFKRPAAGVALETPVRPIAAARAVESDPVILAEPEQKTSGAESGPQSPGVTVQWVKHGGFNVGQECEVELVVRNTSPTVVRSVMVEAVIPPHVEVIGTRPAAVDGSEMPTWTFGELQPEQSRSVMLKVIPKTRGDVQLDAYVRLTGSSSSRFVVQEPMIGVAVSGPDRVEIGQQVGYIVRVSNPGTGLANNVIIQAAVPEGLEHRNGSLLNIEIGTLNPGESRQARLSLTAVQGGEQQLAVRVLADGGLSEQTTTAIEIAEPQLAIALAGPKEPHAGRSENYTLTVSNAGNVQSANVRAKYIVPAGSTFVSADRGGKYVEVDNAVEWFVGTLQPNDASHFAIVMKANETGDVAHNAGVISEHGQVTTCELISNVTGTAALDMKIVSDHRESHVGEEMLWEVVIRNTGTREASNVGVSCELPAGFELIAADGPTKHIAENGVLVFRSIPGIDAAADARIVIRGRCTREGNQRLRLRVASESVTEVLIGEGFASVSQ